MDALSTTEQIEQLGRLMDFSGEVNTVPTKTLMTVLTHTKGEQINLDPKHLRVMPDFNPRIKDKAYFDHIRTIADSIIENGYFADKPLAGISGYEGKRSVIYITDGNCRFEALKIAMAEGAPIQWVPVVLKDRTTTMEDLVVALVKSNEGKRFNPLELAVAAKRLFKYGWSSKKIAQKLGFSEDYVNKLLALAGAPHEIRKMIESGQVGAFTALESMRQHGPDATSVLQDAMVSAQASGHSSITRKHLPMQVFKKTLQKTAPKMADVIERIQQQPAFASLPAELRDSVNELVAMVTEAKKALPQPEDIGETEDA
jgi:ParB family chromosome partitioning protein